MIRDSVILRKIQKTIIEALNICPSDCVEEFQQIFQVIKQDLPNHQVLREEKGKEKNKNKSSTVINNEIKGGEHDKDDQDGDKPDKVPDRLCMKEYLADSIDRMYQDM